MAIYASKFGDWAKAGAILQAISVNLLPLYKARLEENGNLILETLKGHIDNQDLPWVPLSERTIELKGGDDTIYVETGFLRDNLQVRRIKSVKNGVTIFVGASAWKRTPQGLKFSDLMIWLEYGTDKIPPRPLIRPTFDELEPILKEGYRDILEDLIRTGGSD